MNNINDDDEANRLSGSAPVMFPAIFAIILLTVLFQLPRPTIPVSLPYKVEFLLALYIPSLLGYLHINGISPKRLFGGANFNFRLIKYAIGGFVAWSAISVFWASFNGPVAHHTLLWAVYLVFFVVFSGMIRLRTGFRTIMTTFGLAAIILGLLCIFDFVSTGDFASNEGPLRIRYAKYAEMLVTLLPVLWAAAIYSRRRVGMLVLSFAGIIGWLTAMLSLSKGAFIAGIAGFAVFFVGVCLFSPTIFRRRSIAFAVVWLAVTIGTQVLFSVFSAVPSTTDYITGKADPTRTTTEMRIFTWTVGRQMARDHWLAGVGADNFGVAYNDARIQMRLRHPDVPKQEIAEDYLTERAHNEPLQVLAELGVPGFGLFALPFALFAFLLVRKFWRQGFRLSPVLWASAAGMIAFAVSSMVSSFSFRSAQNGVVFFLVFAIAVNELNKSADISTIGDRASYFTAAFCWLSVLLLALYCMAEGFAEYQVYTGERTESPAAAQSRFHSALIADPGYSGAYLSSAARYAAEGDQATAALMTRKAIDTGIGLSLTYSQLAHQQVAAGDNDGAEATYREAIKVYPRSIFIRVEFVVFLENSGRHDAATDELKAAVALEPRQANGWYVLIKSGSTAAFYRSRSDPAIAAPVELLPASAVYHYLDKTPEK